MSNDTSLWQRHDIGSKVIDVLSKVKAHWHGNPLDTPMHGIQLAIRIAREYPKTYREVEIARGYPCFSLCHLAPSGPQSLPRLPQTLYFSPNLNRCIQLSQCHAVERLAIMLTPGLDRTSRGWAHGRTGCLERATIHVNAAIMSPSWARSKSGLCQSRCVDEVRCKRQGSTIVNGDPSLRSG